MQVFRAYLMYSIYVCVRAQAYSAWASMLLFGIEGNTRAQNRETAIVQSRFLFV